MITYEYLRGTRDEGSYLGPSRVLINKRRMREVRLCHQMLWLQLLLAN